MARNRQPSISALMATLCPTCTVTVAILVNTHTIMATITVEATPLLATQWWCTVALHLYTMDQGSQISNRQRVMKTDLMMPSKRKLAGSGFSSIRAIMTSRRLIRVANSQVWSMRISSKHSNNTIQRTVGRKNCSATNNSSWSRALEPMWVIS